MANDHKNDPALQDKDISAQSPEEIKTDGGLSIIKSWFSDNVFNLLTYLLLVFIFEWIIEKLLGISWLFDLTPEKNPIIVALITSFVAYYVLQVVLEGSGETTYVLILAFWCFSAYGDYTDIFEPPANPDTIDLVLAYLFPTTLEGTLFDIFNVIGVLIAGVKILKER